MTRSTTLDPSVDGDGVATDGDLVSCTVSEDADTSAGGSVTVDQVPDHRLP